MRVWITGAGGFLGRNLIASLLEKTAFNVTALTSGMDALKAMFGGDERLEVRSMDALLYVPDHSCGEDILVHCAYPRNKDGADIADGLRYIGTVMKEASRAGFGGIINISSQSVYSPQRTCMADEQTPLSIESVYAAGKYASELMLNLVSAGRPHTSLRLASLIGPGFDQRITNRLVKSAVAAGEICIEDHSRRFGFLDVEDAAAGIISLLETDPSSWKEVYNLGSGTGFTLAEIADTAADVLSADFGKEVRVTVKPGSGTSDSSVSYELLRRDTGFYPSVSLRESIRKIAVRIVEEYEYSRKHL